MGVKVKSPMIRKDQSLRNFLINKKSMLPYGLDWLLPEPHSESVPLGYQSFPDILRMHDALDEATVLSIFFCLR